MWMKLAQYVFWHYLLTEKVWLSSPCCVWILFFLSPNHLGQMGFNPMQTFGVGFFLSLSLFFPLLSDLRHLAYSPGWRKRNKEERGSVWLKWENQREWWAQRGKGQKVGCRGGGGVVAIYGQRVWWHRLKVIFHPGTWRGRRESQSAATGSGDVWHITAKK